MLQIYTRGALQALQAVSKGNRWTSSVAEKVTTFQIPVGSSPSTSLLAQHSTSTPPTLTFHKRQLPESLVAMSSSAGKALFREALVLRGMESYFPLSEQFVTQSEPSFCALSTLAMVLNALNHDPGKAWKGPWRWISEETLQCETRNICGHSLERVKSNGMDFGEFESLAQCHGVRIQSFRSGLPGPGTRGGGVGATGDTSVTSSPGAGPAADAPEQEAQSKEAFRRVIQASASSLKADSFVVVNFSRKALGQTGDGHFSPVGGYHPEKDLVLILDVARFKYPPFWVPLTALWESMSWRDEITGKSRGYFVVISGGGNAVEEEAAALGSKIEGQGGTGGHIHSPTCGHHH